MPKRHSRRCRSRKMRGGSYSSAATYGEYVNGNVNSQFSRTLDQAGPYGSIPGNTIIGREGQNVPPASQIPNSQHLSLIQKAGRHKRGGKTKKSRGGFIGSIVNQAIPPLALWGMQYNYKHKKRGGKTRRH